VRRINSHGIRLYEVGGAVRDELLGVPTKDVDFAVEAPSFEDMRRHVVEHLGLRIFLESPEHLTIRAGIPKGHKLRERCKDADFVLCRKDGPTKDGRRPEYVEPGTISDDLARRDFTVNAIARCAESGKLFDPHNGVDDLRAELLCFVGNAEERIREDALRLLRGVRFSITKGFTIDEAWHFNSPAMLAGLPAVSTERVREELDKMFAHDTLATLKLFEDFPNLRDVVFERDGLSLMPTMKKRK